MILHLLIMIQTDICIIGAGPAGVATSLTLSKMKIHHIILDAAIFPRDKICGDGLDTTVMRVLNSIEPGCVEKEILTNEHFTKGYSFLIHVSETKKTLIELPNTKSKNQYPIFCYCKRSYFDNYLVSKLDPQYAQIFQSAKVEKIINETAEKIVFVNHAGTRIQIKAKLLVGADGAHSVLVKSLGVQKIDRNHYAGALRQYWKGISGLQANHLELYLPKSLPMGYLWIFPLPNGEANVGLGMQSALMAKNKIDLKKAMTELIENDPVFKDRFKNATALETKQGYGLPLASLQKKIYGDGWLLTGDAASLICPTTGEGIGPAMLSGYIAAHFIQRAIQKKDFTADVFKHYDREVYKRLKSSIQLYQLMINTSPIFYNFFFNFIIGASIIRKRIFKYLQRKIELAYTEKIPVNFN